MSADDVPRVLIVGAGVTGSELAWGLARRGIETLLVTTSLDTIANLPGDGWRFEPPQGGLLAQLAAEARDAEGAWRSQALHRAAKRELEREPSLHTLQSNVVGLLVERGRVAGVRTWEGVDRRAHLVALCVGTFLRARLTVGALEEAAGRLAEMAYDELHDDLVAHGVRLVDAEARLTGDDVTPGYVVRYRRLEAGEVDESGRVRALAGAFAFGACAGRADDLGEAAREGHAAVGRLLGALGAAAPPSG
jgi:tRNA U34 5-carboxymethylaminomethyl modifying enzyme MnmG/GidA